MPNPLLNFTNTNLSGLFGNQTQEKPKKKNISNQNNTSPFG
jgi:hypothetical protein